MRLGRRVLLVAVMFVVGTAVVPTQHANAWSSTGYRWYSGQQGTPCGSALLTGQYQGACYVRYVYTGTVSTLHWDSAFRAGAYDWNSFPDPYHANSTDFGYEDYTFSGGLGAAGSGVTMDVLDLGPPNAAGRATLGVSTWYGNGAFSNGSFNSISKSTIQISTNLWLTSASQNGTCGKPRWAVGTAPSYCQLSMEQAVAHEMGHSLGLQHPVTGPVAPGGPVMACSQGYGNLDRPGGDDGNGLRFLYGGYNSHWTQPRSSPC